jgi:Sigma-70 factor, region 1.1
MTGAIRDRVVQGWSRPSRNFQPGSIGFCPKRAAHEAVNEVAKAITLRGRPIRGPAPDAQAAIPGAAWSDVMANAARADEQGGQQVEAPEKDGPLLDLSDAAVKKFIKTTRTRGFVTLEALNAVLRGSVLQSDRGHHVDAVRHGHYRG